jgi:hypothetical protein
MHHIQRWTKAFYMDWMKRVSCIWKVFVLLLHEKRQQTTLHSTPAQLYYDDVVKYTKQSFTFLGRMMMIKTHKIDVIYLVRWSRIDEEEEGHKISVADIIWNDLKFHTCNHWAIKISISKKNDFYTHSALFFQQPTYPFHSHW